MQPAVARVMERISRHGFATLENSALAPAGDLQVEITVLYADRRFVRIVRRVLIGHEAFDAYEAVVPITQLRAVLRSPLIGPILRAVC